MNRHLRIVVKALLLVVLLYVSWLMAELSLPYREPGRNIGFLRTKIPVYHIGHWRLSFYIHVFTSILALLAGFTQFSRGIMYRLPVLHRAAGYVYAADVLLVTGPAALVLAFYANGGLPARVSFILLAMLWLYFTTMAVIRARQRRFDSHGGFMLRSYALTLSAIALRSYAWLFDVLHIGMRPVHVYIFIAWASWVPNLLLAELMIRAGFIRYLLRRPQKEKPGTIFT